MLSLFSRSTFVASSRSFSTSPLACKSVADSVKDAADKVSRIAARPSAAIKLIHFTKLLGDPCIFFSSNEQANRMAGDALKSTVEAAENLKNRVVDSDMSKQTKDVSL